MKTLLRRSCCRCCRAAGAGAALRRPRSCKIGYVNSERVLREAMPAKAAQAKLEAEFGKREKELNDVAAPR